MTDGDNLDMVLGNEKQSWNERILERRRMEDNGLPPPVMGIVFFLLVSRKIAFTIISSFPTHPYCGQDGLFPQH